MRWQPVLRGFSAAITPPVAACKNRGVILSVSASRAGASAWRADLIVAAGEATDG